MKGTWENGIWRGGNWQSGTWINGIWEGAEIFSYKFNKFIFSNSNPSIFKKLENSSKTIEELSKSVLI